MPGKKVGSLDIQFGKDFDQAKANQLVQSLQQTIAAVNFIANATTTPPTPGVAVHELANQSALGPDHTVKGLAAGQVLVATSPTSAHFAALKFSQMAGVDPASFANAVNGDVIALVGGFWSAVPNTIGGLTDPGANAIAMWNEAAHSLAWALPGVGIKILSGQLAVDDTQLVHAHLQGLAVGNDHPQYALLANTPQLTAANAFTALNVFDVGLVSLSDITLGGNLEQVAQEPEIRTQNTDDAVNEGTWRTHVEPGQEMHAAVNDDGSDAENWLSVQRIGDVIDTIALQATYLTFNGFDVCCGELVPGAGPMPTTIIGYLTVTVGGRTIKVPYLVS